MRNDTNSFDMYAHLLEQQDEYENTMKGINLPSSLNGYSNEDDDSEDFLTSKELVKCKEKIEKKLGLTSDDDGIIEETVHFKRYTKRRKHKYTESEMEEIRNSCRQTIVHDYGEYDIYHISDEDRAKNDQLATISMKLGKLKRTYRRVDQYIEAMRIVFEAWSILEKTNYIHTRDEFYKMVADGTIISNRILMPKLIKINQYNMDMIINYISNPELDASRLIPKKIEHDYDSFYNDEEEFETEEEEMGRYLSKDEVAYLLEDSPEKMEIGYVNNKYIKGYDRRTLKKRKRENKSDKHIRESLSRILNKIQTDHYKDFGSSYSVTNTLFEQTNEEKSIFDDLKFTGSWSDEAAVELYNIKVNELLLSQNTVKEKYLTYGDKQLSEFYKILEDNGINTIDLRRKVDSMGENKSNQREKAEKKENKIKESIIFQRIISLNDNPKFKKITKKAENALNEYKEGEN